MNPKKWDRLRDNLDIGFLKRVPLVYQTETAECGLACLSMICGYYGNPVDLISLRHRCSLSSRGATLAGIERIAGQLEMVTRALSLELEDLPRLKLPCILHWDFSHFVVLVKARRQRLIIHDPARGRRSIPLNVLAKHFTGVALEVWPGSHFTAKTPSPGLRLRALIRGVKGLVPALIKIGCLSLVIETINLLMPVGTQLVMDQVVPAGDGGLLMLICTGLLVFILLRTAIGLIRAWSSLVMGTLIDVQWKAGLFSHLLTLPITYFERRKLGDIHARFASLDVLRATFTKSVVGAVMDGMMVAGAAAMMVFYGGHLVWVVCGFSLLYVGIRFATYDSYRQLSQDELVRDARANSYFMETLYGIQTIKMQGMAERRRTCWLNLMIDKINTQIKVSKMTLFFDGVNGFINACEQVIILWLGTRLVIDNRMTLGMMVAFGAFRAQFSDRMASLISFVLQLRMLGLHNERIADIALHAPAPTGALLSAHAFSGPVSLTADNIGYRYDSQSPPVFSQVDFRIAPGESVAITGPSGAGKTTLVKVLCGLFPPDTGTIKVNDIDIYRLGLNHFHQMIACVMQDDKLFSGSLRENICGFGPCEDEAWMIACARAGHVHDTIMAMPMGYDTTIGELGEGLSGGQKQRVFIARALYRKPAILFMDEATSHLDKSSEEAVNQAIKTMRITRVIIAHRESTLRSADRILTL